MRRFGGIAALVVVAGVAAACGTSGNGVAGETPSQILAAAVAATKSAQSVHASGSGTQGSTQFTIDLEAFKSGDIDGTISENGNTASIIVANSTSYIKGDLGFWTKAGLSSSQAAAAAGKWISESGAQATSNFSAFTIDGIANSLTQNVGTLSAGTTGTVSGQSAISIKSSTNGILWVATTGPAYPLEIVKTGGSSGTGTILLTGWNQGSVPSAPSGAVSAASIFSGSSGSTGNTGATTTTTPGSTGSTGNTGATTTTAGSTGSTGNTGATTTTTSGASGTSG